MIAAALLGLSLVVTATYEPTDFAPNAEAKSSIQMTAQQKFAALRPLVRSATDCVVHAITADPRFRLSATGANMNELIVASMTGNRRPHGRMTSTTLRLVGSTITTRFCATVYR
jgi:hypothetical protein